MAGIASYRWGRRGAGVLFRYVPACRRLPCAPKYLLLHRSWGVLEPRTWGIPGGKVEEGETPKAGAFREVEEEVGSFPVRRRVLKRCQVRAPEDAFLYTTYVIDVERPFTPALNWESTGARWVTTGEAKRLPLHPGVEQLLASACFRKSKRGGRRLNK